MSRRPPRSTRTDTLFPYTTLCRSLAGPEGSAPPGLGESHIRVATKYPATTRRWFEAQGIQAECIKLNGAMEIAPKLGLASHIVDLGSTRRTLVAHARSEARRVGKRCGSPERHRRSQCTSKTQT